MTATVRVRNARGPVGLVCELFPQAGRCHRCGLLAASPPLCRFCVDELVGGPRSAVLVMGEHVIGRTVS